MPKTIRSNYFRIWLPYTFVPWSVGGGTVCYIGSISPGRQVLLNHGSSGL